MRLQRTIKNEIVFSGIGLHTGKDAAVRLKPAPRDKGVVFYRVDKGAIIKAGISSVIDTSFSTTIGFEGVKIRTIEHLMAALAGLGIDNIYVEVDGPEIPILDGSSTEIAGMLLKAGIAKQGKKLPYIKITRPVVYEDAHAKIAALPYDGRRLSYFINFGHRAVGMQELSIDISEETFVKDIAPARTFGFLRDVERLMANGLAKGGSLDNAVIIGDDGVLNTAGLRFEDEFVRHKILDSIGDLSIIGYPIEGYIILEKSGHTANINFLKKLIASVDCYSFISETVECSTEQALYYS